MSIYTNRIEIGTCIFAVSAGVCTCNEPFRGPDCSIDSTKPPSIVKTELTCNGFCQNVIITGDGFFKSNAMQSEFTDIEVSDEVVTYLYTMRIILCISVYTPLGKYIPENSNIKLFLIR